MALCAAGASATSIADWSPSTGTFAASVNGPDVELVAVRGTGGSGYVDDTAAFATADGQTQHSSGWETVNVADYGMPADASAVEISVKGIITKGQTNASATVYMFVRAAGSACCLGPPGHEGYPVDANYGNPVRGLVLQTVAQLPADGRREIDTVTVAVADGKFEWSWGYRRADIGAWPVGDALAINVYLNGYYR